MRLFETERRFCSWLQAAHLGMYQSIVEEDEPVHREPSRVLKGQAAIAALTDQTPLRLPQGVLRGGQRQNDTISLLTDCDLRWVLQSFIVKARPF